MSAQPATQPSPPPSPFLPGTFIQYAWDSTSLGYLKQCPRLYKYMMIDGWGSSDESVHLRFGIEYHRALQDYDLERAEGINHDDAVFDVIKELMIRTADFNPDPDTKAGKYKSRAALIRTVIWYLDEHKDDPAQTYVKADGKPAVELSFRFELDWGPQITKIEEGVFKEEQGMNRQPYILCGHLDKVVNFGGELYGKDYKTTTSTPGPYYFNQFQPNNQMSLYTLASQVILDSPVKGMIIDAAQLLVDSSRFVRGLTQRTPDQLAEWTADLRFWFGLAESYANAGYWPMNDTACDKFGGCRFREVCSKSPGVREQYLKSDFVKLPEEERWNPLKPR